ncbi:hypothetical protein Cgig2_024709 [Carnegiea gigantea]|uniref:Uncharacterized protein n=1 Tax=Carnegiea gigantea TaxID=171969 RepID=A0A9Q1GJS5_9CARY|nr:hypothetical protein Cgig2_024709 [Carnegiea gigantea]
MTNEDEQVNEKEHHSKGVKDEGKAKDQVIISKVTVAADLIRTSSQWPAEVITELEEFIPGARSPLKRVRKADVESVSDALIRYLPKRSKSRMPILSQDSYESEGFLMQIDAIEKHLMRSRDKFAIPSSSLGVSQEEKEPMFEGVVVVDSQPDSLAAVVQVINYDVEDVVTRCMTTLAQCISTPLLPGPIMLCFQEDNNKFIDRSLLRITKPDLQIRDVQTTTNTNKGKAVLVEAPKRRRTRSA